MKSGRVSVKVEKRKKYFNKRKSKNENIKGRTDRVALSKHIIIKTKELIKKLSKKKNIDGR